MVRFSPQILSNLTHYLEASVALKSTPRMFRTYLGSLRIAGTLEAVRLRLKVLKSALRKPSAVVPRGFDGSDAPRGTRYSFREKRAPAGTLAESAFVSGNALPPLAIDVRAQEDVALQSNPATQVAFRSEKVYPRRRRIRFGN